jgi:translation initiation factor 2B subunit (eIF-2B alpha/beta/delta family)
MEKGLYINVDDEIRNIRDDEINGSSQITRNAINLFSRMVPQLYDPKNKIIIDGFAKDLILSKPSMAALRNLINVCLNECYELQAPYDFSEAEKKILRLMDDAAQISVGKGISSIFDNHHYINILTCSYSSIFLKLIIEAVKMNYDCHILALESNWRIYQYGHIVADECKKNKIKADVFKDSDMLLAIEKSDCVLIGADSIITNLGVVNGLPSYELAVTAKSKIPLYVVAESFKHSYKTNIDLGFDFVPIELVTDIFSDEIFIE